MTLHNKGPYVLEAVQSVLASTLEDFELLVVDDASTDDGPAIVRSIVDPRVKLFVSETNQGRPAAANRGLDLAAGEYVAVLDADDRMSVDRLAKQAGFLDRNSNVGAVGSWLPAFGGDGRTYAMPTTDPDCRALALFGMPVSYPAAMFRRSVIQEHHLRCDTDWLTPGMDYLFVLKVGAHAAYANIEERLTHYRVGEQNMRHGRDPWADGRILATEVLKRMGLPHDERSVRAHLMLGGVLPRDPSGSDMRAVAGWISFLKRWCASSGYCPADAMDRELQKRSEWLFMDVLRSQPRIAGSFLFSPGQFRWPRARHYAAAVLRRGRA
ncbi:MAG: glycosyltransferase family 2 protein [Flavobacteriales bacterium]|nr:glycosyltransferase family 2 protein [Flavobacteriales bacterium]